MHNNANIKSVAILGLGLIGGGLAKSFTEHGLTLYGYDTCKDTLRLASDDNIFEFVTDDIDIVLDAKPDLIYLALPIFATLDTLDILASKNVCSLITDAASCKKTICERANKLGLKFIGGHPIAGKEVSGYANSDGRIFKGARHILISSLDEADLELLKALHTMIGMRVDIMQAAQHDKIFAAVSHLPHLIAFNLIDYVELSDPELFNYAGAGFKDFTRIAASDEFMWSHIFMSNKEEILRSVESLESVISEWKTLIKDDKYIELKEKIKTISSIRRGLK